ncbi:MAG: type II toxin-antitoxin system VapC family toxin [Bacteroidota bacterium]
MTGNKCFLDTSVIIHVFKDNKTIVKALKTFDEVYISSIAVGELYFGAYASTNLTKHLKQVHVFLADCTIVPLGLNTSVVYGKLKAELKKAGTPIPENDIWIAAMALENELPLFTTDNHFKLTKVDLITI